MEPGDNPVVRANWGQLLLPLFGVPGGGRGHDNSLARRRLNILCLIGDAIEHRKCLGTG